MNMYERIAAAERNGLKQGEPAKEREPTKEGESTRQREAPGLNGQVNGVPAKHE